MYFITTIITLCTIQEFLAVRNGTPIIAKVESIENSGAKNDRKIEISFKYKNSQGLNIEETISIPSLAYDPEVIKNKSIHLKLSSSGIHHLDSYKETKFYSVLCLLMLSLTFAADIRIRKAP